MPLFIENNSIIFIHRILRVRVNCIQLREKTTRSGRISKCLFSSRFRVHFSLSATTNNEFTADFLRRLLQYQNQQCIRDLYRTNLGTYVFVDRNINQIISIETCSILDEQIFEKIIRISFPSFLLSCIPIAVIFIFYAFLHDYDQLSFDTRILQPTSRLPLEIFH